MADNTNRKLPAWRAPMDIADARRYQVRAVKAAERIMYDAYEKGDDQLALKANTRITQAVQTYLKILEVHELEERLEAMEKALEEQSD